MKEIMELLTMPQARKDLRPEIRNISDPKKRDFVTKVEDICLLNKCWLDSRDILEITQEYSRDERQGLPHFPEETAWDYVSDYWRRTEFKVK